MKIAPGYYDGCLPWTLIRLGIDAFCHDLVGEEEGLNTIDRDHGFDESIDDHWQHHHRALQDLEQTDHSKSICWSQVVAHQNVHSKGGIYYKHWTHPDAHYR